MALFSIQRYTGEEVKDTSTADSKAQNILQRLHEQAELKKQKQEKQAFVERKQKVRNNKRKHENVVNASPIKKKFYEEPKQNEELEKIVSCEREDKKTRRKSKNNNKQNSQERDAFGGKETATGRESVLSTSVLSTEAEESDISGLHLSTLEGSHEDGEGEDNSREQQSHEEIGGFTVIGAVREKKLQKVSRVLPEWLANPSIVTNDVRTEKADLDSISQLDPYLKEKLRKNGITHFFPVQKQVIPMLLQDTRFGFQTGRGGYRPNDICCSAPTGSGKTLAFVLPVVQALKPRMTCHVRALVVLPVRDLAYQVYKVFSAYTEGTKLQVRLITGQKTLVTEQRTLVKQGPHGYESLADIVVATPGRLVDHLHHTPGFSLQHLRFLVIDEADRMMDEVKQDWLSQVENAVYKDQYVREKPGKLTAARASKLRTPLQKLLFSATLSQNPEKLQLMNLFLPKLFTSVVKVDSLSPAKVNSSTAQEDMSRTESQKSGEFAGKYTTPSGLTEKFVESTPGEKPLIILYFLHHLKFRHVLCFTNNLENTHRLYWLIRLVGGIRVEEFSSQRHANKRARLIKQFEKGEIDILICSDAMARGMDLNSVRYVISYDSPPYLKTYIHRVGRTARAGNVGTAITLLERQRILYFKKMLAEAGKTNVKELKLQNYQLEPHVPAYQEALKELPEVLQSEKKKKTS